MWGGAKQRNQPASQHSHARAADGPGDRRHRHHQHNAGGECEHADRPLVAEPQREPVQANEPLWPIDPSRLAIQGETTTPETRDLAIPRLVNTQRDVEET